MRIFSKKRILSESKIKKEIRAVVFYNHCQTMKTWIWVFSKFELNHNFVKKKPSKSSKLRLALFAILTKFKNYWMQKEDLKFFVTISTKWNEANLKFDGFERFLLNCDLASKFNTIL